MIATMAKEKRTPLFAEISASVKARFDRLAAARKRKLNAELEMAMVAYLDREERKEGLAGKPLDEEDE